MDINILGICVTAFFGFIALALAIFFGLRGFTKDVGSKVTKAEENIITELSGIKGTITRIDERATTIVQLTEALFTRGTAGTIEGVLKNFGKTKVSAEPGSSEIVYVIEVEKGKLDNSLISRLSKKTGFTKTAVDMFGSAVMGSSIGRDRLRITIPSADSKLCAQYMNLFLQWLDTEYAEGLQREIAEFEEGIRF